MKTFCLIILASLCLLAVIPGCQKEETAAPVADTVLSESKLVGRWEATFVKMEVRDTTGVLKYSKEKRKDVGYFENGVGPIGRYWSVLDISYVEFNTDHTFIQHDKDNYSPSYMLRDMIADTGRWALVSPEELRLTTQYLTTYDTTWLYRYNDSTLGIAISITDTTGPMTNNWVEFWTVRLERQ